MPDARLREALELFVQKARTVSLTAIEVKNLSEALDFALKATLESIKPEKPGNDVLGASAAASLDAPAEASAAPRPEARVKKTGRLFISGAPERLYEKYRLKALECGIEVINSGMRSCPGGIEAAFSRAFLGIAGTATLCLDLASEEIRLSTMLAETHFIAVSRENIVLSAEDASPALKERIKEPGSFTAFVSGPSRTADIERVLTIGAHGPLKVCALIMEEPHAD